MPRFKHPAVLALVVLSLVAGCQTPADRPAGTASLSETTRNNCYSLLHQLLDENKEVTLLRFIKHENTDLKALLKRVAETCRLGEKQLDDFAQSDRSLQLDRYGLPEGEMKTRDAIGAAKEKELLHSSDDQLEVFLLLDQIEAMNYGSYLARVAAENDVQGVRARYLTGLSTDLKNLRDQITARLQLRNPAPPKSQ